jgi:cysteine desulfurase
VNVHPGLADVPVYLDYNATTPVDPRVVAALQPYLAGDFGNPSSSHTSPPHPPAHFTPPGSRWPL